MPLDIFGDFGFAGASATVSDQYQDAQTCFNFYPEVSQTQTAKTVTALLGCPGLVQVVADPAGGVNTNAVLYSVYVNDWQGNQLQYSTARTNECPYSSSIGDSNWTVQPGVSVTLNATTDPAGTSTASLIDLTSASSAKGVFIACFGTPNGSSNTKSVWLKGFAGGEIVTLADPEFTGLTTNCTLTTSWQQFKLADIGQTTAWGIWIKKSSGNKIYAAFAECEIAPDVGSYIATTSAAVTVTDYAHTGNDIVFATAPVSGAIITANINSSPPLVSVGTGDGTTTTFAIPASNTWPPASSVMNLPVRGMWALPGQVTALVVIGTTCYLATLTNRGSQSTPPTVTLTSVGALLTRSGPVCIRDNNSGGYALIVDGTYGYTYNLSTQAFAHITDTNFTSFANPSTVAFIDGWWIVGTVGSQKFFTNSPIYSTGWDATFFALKDGASDNLMAVIENKEQLWLIGERTTEIWYDAGSQNFAFQRIYGQLIQYGCAATYSVSRLTSNGGTGIISSDSLIWLGRNNRGENVVVRTQGFNIGIVSTNEVSNSIAQMTDVSDAIGYTYEEDGHEFYVLTFPSADITWVYDSTMPPEFAWHQRGSYDPYTQTEHRHRSNCEMNFGGTTLVGDYQNGAIYQMTRSAYTDAGWPLLARRRSPFVWNPQSRRRVQMASLQVAFAPGVGTSANMGSDPQASLRISRDYGTTYGPPILAALGKIGNYVNRCIWRKLGWSRGAVAQIEVIDPVRRDIVGVTLKAFGS